MSDAHAFLLDKILGLVRDYPIRSVLDYGCGTGALMKQAGEKARRSLALTGIDYFASYEEKERPVSDAKHTFIDRGGEGFAAFLATAPKYDLVVSTFALHHYRNPVKELQGLEEMLHPGGLLFVADMNFDNGNDARRAKNLTSYVGEMFAAFRGKYHRHHYAREEALDLFRALDVKVLESADFEVPNPPEGMEVEARGTLQHLEHMEKMLPEFPTPLIADFFRMAIDYEKKAVPDCKIDYSANFFIIAKKRC